MCTAKGDLLQYSEAHRDPAKARQHVEAALSKWDSLPARGRRPGAFRVGEPAKVDKHLDIELSDRGLVVWVYARALDYANDGRLIDARLYAAMDKASRDNMWLAESEWETLIPKNPRNGMKSQMNQQLIEKIARFHLRDNTRNGGPLWKKTHLQHAEATLTVQELNSRRLQVRIDGSLLLSINSNVEVSNRGFDARIGGTIDYDRLRGTITRFDVVAIGDHWELKAERCRPGRHPLGIAFELSRGDPNRDRLPPFGARNRAEYFGKWAKSY